MLLQTVTVYLKLTEQISWVSQNRHLDDEKGCTLTVKSNIKETMIIPISQFIIKLDDEERGSPSRGRPITV